ncbi:leader peptidase (prepilin peptidase) / N-methyltransferase [Paenibacillus catalpae]|uniref:Leader peptidase (Prepilin peptidase) / N-methyltransferase n=1 Tax=Paenibacillus catalpae TaxID=1045775 RepID=A0A1I2EXP1_9BACL|nr:A24 family peptidase [Paenibacillus catalpae]SFE97549.1 leader peptidase (prepilin peptidase) / N-methyltransferase [Paenibacillus catalpae]
MTLFLTIYLFILGLIVGSFFNVVGLRVPIKLSVVSPPSQCPKCGNRLRPRDLMPVVSYMLSRGQCRQCGKRISPLYPMGELATGLLFAWIYLTFGNSWDTVIGLLLVSMSVILTVSDLKYMLLPNRILLAFAPVFLVLRCLFPDDSSVWLHVWGAIAGGGVLLAVVILTRGGMGLGDVKLIFLLGWILGLPNLIPAFILACFFGSLVGGLLILFKIVKRKQPIPFGPFLLLGALLSFAYGDTIIDCYHSILM